MFRDSSFKAVHGQMITFLWKQISQALRLPVGREAFCRPTEETSGIINDCVIWIFGTMEGGGPVGVRGSRDHWAITSSFQIFSVVGASRSRFIHKNFYVDQHNVLQFKYIYPTTNYISAKSSGQRGFHRGSTGSAVQRVPTEPNYAPASWPQWPPEPPVRTPLAAATLAYLLPFP